MRYVYLSTYHCGLAKRSCTINTPEIKNQRKPLWCQEPRRQRHVNLHDFATRLFCVEGLGGWGVGGLVGAFLCFSDKRMTPHLCNYKYVRDHIPVIRLVCTSVVSRNLLKVK